MASTTEVDLTRKYTFEERDAMVDAYADALDEGKRKEAHEIVKHIPIHPRLAKIIAEVIGKDFLVKNFNITYANDVLGEGWMDGK